MCKGFGWLLLSWDLKGRAIWAVITEKLFQLAARPVGQNRRFSNLPRSGLNPVCIYCREPLIECPTPDSTDEIGLRHVHQKSVAVEIPLANGRRVLRGRGTFAISRTLGGLLQIECEDTYGSFEFLIRERQWNGSVRLDSKYGCEFFIRLA